MWHHQLAVDLVEYALAEVHSKVAVVNIYGGWFISKDAFQEKFQFHFDGIDLFGLGYIVGDVLFGVIGQLYFKLVFLIGRGVVFYPEYL